MSFLTDYKNLLFLGQKGFQSCLEILEGIFGDLEV